MKKCILDVDTGTDDAVAIMIAALHPEIELVACTVVNGNTTVDYCTDNTLRVIDHINRSFIPVYKGAHRPLSRLEFPVPKDPDKPKAMHGTTLNLNRPTSREKAIHASQFLVDYFKEDDEETTLIAVGPLTNLATSLLLDPEFAKNVKSLIIMGGGHRISNTGASAEFNFWADPEAAAVVLGAGFPDITLITLDATHDALITYEQCDQLEECATAAATAAVSFIRKRIDFHESEEKMAIVGSAPVHDALCIGALLDPTMIHCETLNVSVEVGSAQSVGRSIIDTCRKSGCPPNAKVALGSNREKFHQLMLNTLSLS